MQENSVKSSKRKLLILVFISVAMLVGLLAVILISNQQKPFTLVGTDPVQGTAVSPEKSSVVFSFSKELPLKQGDGFNISVTPSVDFFYAINGDTLLVKLESVLLDDTIYSVSVNNVYSIEEDILPVAAGSINVVYENDARGFLDNLPYKSSGFSIIRVSEYGVFVLSHNYPDEQRFTEADELMKENGLSPGLFQVGTGSDAEDSLAP